MWSECYVYVISILLESDIEKMITSARVVIAAVSFEYCKQCATGAGAERSVSLLQRKYLNS